MTPRWPTSLAARLVVLLVSALAVAQGVVVLVLHDEQRGIVETMAHGQALNQVVTLARLLAAYPPAEADRLTAAFGSRVGCARLVDAGTAAEAAREPPSPAERRLGEALTRMLHGDYAGAPHVTLEKSDFDVHPCEDVVATAPPHGAAGRTAPPAGTYSADLWVPLADGRTLVYRTLVETPRLPVTLAVLSFLLSAVAIGAVVVVSVAHQTRGLRDLARAAERLGRGEEGAPLAPRGPAEIVAAIRAFDTMQDRLRRFMRDRLRLLAAVSHDLRTPLTTLRLKAEFVEDEAVRDDLVVTLDELTAITESTLAFTRTEASGEETRRVDLGELVGEVAGELGLTGADVAVTIEAAAVCDGRPIALKRAVRNLVENAVRYGERARVAVGLEDGQPLIRIDDDGPGLAPDRIEEAFEPFVRLEPSRSRETGGTGLGLAIARGVVQAHGGTVSLANRASGGLRAEIRLPRPAAP